jgi:hypothetical protein
MFVLMGLNHLREWIAPGYSHLSPAASDAERFYNQLFAFPEYGLIKSLCNHSKHLEAKDGPISYVQVNSIDSWPDLDSVANFDLGPPVAYFVGDRNVEDIISSVINYYREHWFARPVASQVTPSK